ncbi:MAG TPA: primosomal protein N' [Candidatus Binatia bacterium]|jgi:primosomal protein N' (replication factor Y)|nr:primosomal protein N' [Candidatus Binatia bacterium]
MHGLVEIAPLPPVPLRDLFTYSVPDLLQGRIQPGMRVRVPLGKQTRTGVVAGFPSSAPPGDIRAVIDLLDHDPFLPSELLELCRWTARYYFASLAEVIATIVPSKVPAPSQERAVRLARALAPDESIALARRAPARARAYRLLADAPDGLLTTRAAHAAGLGDAVLRGLVTCGLAEMVQTERPRTVPASTAYPRPTLTTEQRVAANAIIAAVASAAASSFLLHGITGSGKTEVFLTAAEATLAADRDVLVLVPEIALTHQLVERVRGRFGDQVAVLHSGLGPRERWTEWRRIRSREARVVVGARSAVFAPVARLGLVVVDEEHDAAYKQEDGIRYNARDLAVVRARLASAAVVLASATPSAESYHAAQDGRHALLSLTGRPTAQSLPEVEIVDLRQRSYPDGGNALLSDTMRDALEHNLAAGHQSLVFLNRRGFATYLQCPACGTAASCPHCSVTLTWHRHAGALVCHHCHHHRPPTPKCEGCGGPPLQAFGVGTEQIESIIQTYFPDAAVDRMDRDAANRPGAQRRILQDWQAGETDILVGTQMVSKGHDVPGVTLVAVLLADLSLNMPDFRAGERTFQLLVQVAGRAGRGDAPGRVLVQTFRPGHPSLEAAARHDYVGFMAGELERRRELGYPPFARMVNLRLDGRDPAAVEDAATALAKRLRTQAAALELPLDTVMGPAPPPIERIKGRHRWQVLLRAAAVPPLRALARVARTAEAALRRDGVRLVIDVDPYSM